MPWRSPSVWRNWAILRSILRVAYPRGRLGRAAHRKEEAQAKPRLCKRPGFDLAMRNSGEVCGKIFKGIANAFPLCGVFVG